MFGIDLLTFDLFQSGQVMVMAALPFVELRLALPVALMVFKMPIIEAYFLSVIGNSVPAIFLIFVLPRMIEWLRLRSKLLDSFFTWWFTRIVRDYESKLATWGMMALMIFVAIPLPMTGAWTGSVAAYIFKLPKNLSFIYIVIGVMISGIIVTLLTLGGEKFF